MRNAIVKLIFGFLTFWLVFAFCTRSKTIDKEESIETVEFIKEPVVEEPVVEEPVVEEKLVIDWHRYDFAVSAKEIIQDYEENEISANEKYLNKRFAIAGYIDSIRTTGLLDESGLVIDLKKSKSKYTLDEVRCYFLENQIPLAKKYAKNDIILVICTGDGTFMGDPKVKDCVFEVETEKPTNQDKSTKNIPSIDY